MSLFKVQTVTGKVTAFKGTDKNTTGVEERDATLKAGAMNDQAQRLGLKVRYEVAPMDDAA